MTKLIVAFRNFVPKVPKNAKHDSVNHVIDAKRRFLRTRGLTYVYVKPWLKISMIRLMNLFSRSS